MSLSANYFTINKFFKPKPQMAYHRSDNIPPMSRHSKDIYHPESRLIRCFLRAFVVLRVEHCRVSITLGIEYPKFGYWDTRVPMGYLLPSLADANKNHDCIHVYTCTNHSSILLFNRTNSKYKINSVTPFNRWKQ